MKKGFAPLEIMLGLAIMSLVGGTLTQVLFQLTSSLKKVSFIADTALQELVVQNLWEKEFAGALVPELIPIEQEEKKQEQKKIPEKELKKEEQKEQKKTVLPPKAFYYQNRAGNLELLTFITTNPLQVYDTSKPRLVRVIYRLLPDKKRENLFVLHRQETPEIMNEGVFENESTIKGFVVATGIQKISLEFLAYLQKQELDKQVQEKKEEQKEQKKDNPEKEEKELIKRESWDANQNKQEERQDGKKMPLIPNFIKCTFVIGLEQNSTQIESTFAPCYGIVPVIIKGRKPLQVREKTKQERGQEQLEKVMDEKPITLGLEEKFNKYFTDDKKANNNDGPVTRGMR